MPPRLPSPFVRSPDGSLDPDAIQRNFDALSMVLPLGTAGLQAGAITTAKLAANAATKVHTVTGTTSGPTLTTAAGTEVLDEMELTADFGGNPVLILFSGMFSNASAGGSVGLTLYDDGNSVAASGRTYRCSTASAAETCPFIYYYVPASGSRTLDLRWIAGTGTATATGTARQFNILELRR